MQDKKTDFGFKNVSISEKTDLVKRVFNNVASRYDIMNDLMSGGLHRLWKKQFVSRIPRNPTTNLLDVAGGTGDITLAYMESTSDLKTKATVYDINEAMLEKGRVKAFDKNNFKNITWECGPAEKLPFKDNTFDAYTISFGLRNVTEKEAALAEAFRVLKPGGTFLCLEFSQVDNATLEKLYNFYSLKVIPLMGKVVANDGDSYKYLVESIRRFPDQETLKGMIETAGFKNVVYENLNKGIVAIHQGWK